MRRFLRWLAAAVASVLALLAVGTWLIVHDEVSRLRSISAKSPPLNPLMRDAIVAADGIRSTSPTAWVLVRFMSPHHRPLRRLFETALTTFVVSRLFEPEELLRMYAHEAYLGTIEHRQILSVESASQVYFRKPADALTTAEAALLAGMIRSPNIYSPVRNPDRAIERRNVVLKRMHEMGFIDQGEFQRAVNEPLR
ncbi:MAG TPA: transglycosylase domain-containing protein [Thermoanaerobaculia bacterium]|nr:transglycosylase domain-containing protein [Thermoanaerobaculia bacterium]